MKGAKILQAGSVHFSERGGTLGARSMGDATKRRREMEECVQRYNRAHPHARISLSVGFTLDENAFVVEVSSEAGSVEGARQFLNWLTRAAPDEAASWVLPAWDLKKVEGTPVPRGSAPSDPSDETTNRNVSHQPPIAAANGTSEQLVGAEPNERELPQDGVAKKAVDGKSDAVPGSEIDRPVTKAEPGSDSSVASNSASPNDAGDTEKGPAQPVLPIRSLGRRGDPTASSPSVEGDPDLQNAGQGFDLRVAREPGGLGRFNQPPSEPLTLKPPAAKPCVGVEVLVEHCAYAVLHVAKGKIAVVTFSSDEELARFLEDPAAGAFEALGTTNVLQAVEVVG